MSRFHIALHGGVAALALSISAVCTASPVMAKNTITLPTSSLEDALNALSRQSGAQILVDQTLLRGKKAQAVRGASSVEGALALILRGSGLSYQKRGNAFLVVRGSGAARPRADIPARPAHRQTAQRGAEAEQAVVAGQGDSIVVTGSRIARPDLESAMPVSVTKMDEAFMLGRVSAYDALKRDPALGIGQDLASASTGWDAGIQAVNLRNLGVNRSLTLIDGQRRVSSSARSSAVDINMIPVGMIDRVEVVTGGAAAIYGADAVTGAVNIITKRDINALNITATTGITDKGDANEFMVSISTGGKFADGRGSIAIGGTYSKIDPLMFLNRFNESENIGYVGNPANTGPDDGIYDNLRGDNFSQIYYAYDPSFWLNNKEYLYQNGSVREAKCDFYFVTGQYSLCDGGDGRTLEDHDQFRGGLKTLSVMGRVDYALTDSIEYSAYFSYGRSTYDGTAVLWRDDARTLAFSGAGGAVAYLDNPYLPDSIRQVMLANGLTRLNISRTYGNFPIREEDHDRENFTLGQSLGGNLTGNLKWQAFWQYGRTEDDAVTRNTPYKSHWVAARDVISDPVTGQPVCRDAVARANGCVPLNIFSKDQPDQALLDYVLGDRHEKRVNTQQIYGASINGQIFSLPHGDVSVALGIEHRKETLKTTDDPLALSGELVHGFISPAAHPELDVSSSVTEAYGEIVIPVLRDLPFIRYLEVEGAYRYSDYKSIGSTDTWKAGASWSPVSGITFRGVRSRSVRAPNFGELYEPQVVTAQGSINDPCESGFYYNTPTRAANCAALGIAAPLEEYKVGPLTTTGGNPDLRPETSNSLTLGVVLQPKFLPGFDLTVDYWNIDIKNVITQFSFRTLMELCVDLPDINNQYCDRVVRDPDTGVPTSVLSNQINAARLYARGIDIGANYRFPLGAGQFNLAFKGSYLLKQVTETTPGIAAGNVDADGGWQNPRFKATLLTAYSLGKVNIALDTRFMSASTYDLKATSDEAYPDNSVPARIYNDLAVQWNVSRNYNITFGVRNMFDVMPPYFPAIYRDRSVYDVVGRYFYTSAKLKF